VIDLYSAPTLNGVRAKIMLDECGLPYRLYKINTAEGDNKRPEFLALNPMGHVPVIVDDDGPNGAPLTLTHSHSILMYLADKANRFLPRDSAQRLRTIDALANVSIDLGQTLDSMIVLSRGGDLTAPGFKLFRPRFAGYLGVWDKALLTSRYCAGDEVSIADFAMISIHARARQLDPSLLEGYGGLDRWAGDMNARPGVQAGLNFG